MIARDNDGQYIGVQCDECSTPTPDTAAIMAAHGLVKMGWFCSGGTHICPDCPHPKTTRNER